MKNKASVATISIFTLFGTAIMLFSLLSESNLFFLMTGGILLLVSLLFIRNQYNQVPISEEKTYEWYKEKYPHNVRGSIVTCFTCENNSIDVKLLTDETFKWEYYCTQCGKTLYYSA